jgi:integrase
VSVFGLFHAVNFKATKAERAKAHELPLSLDLQLLIQAMPKTGAYIFSMNGHKPISVGSRQKNRLAKRAGVSEWTYHDLRRTGATRMAENGVSRFIIERVLGHADSSVTGVYDRASYRVEKLGALEALSKTIEKTDPDNVSRFKHA